MIAIQGRFDEALELINQVLNKNPTSRKALMGAHRWTDAQSFLQSWMAENPKSSAPSRRLKALEVLEKGRIQK